jgi:NAD(P)H-flavin reductase
MPAGLPDPMLPAPWRIRRVRRDTRDTFTLDLEPVNVGDSLQFLPGQFNMLYVFGAGEVPISMSGDPAESGAMTHTVRAVGVVTKAMSKLKRGDEIGVRGPFGASWPVEDAAGKDVVIVAGGIGLAPLRPVVYALIANRDHYERAFLLYGGRESKQLLFRGELDRWRDGGALDIDLTVDIAGAEWRGSVGVVPSLLARTVFDPSNAVALVCGPEAMIRFTATALIDRGLDPDSIHLSMERNMKCAVGQCGHCQFGPEFVCRDGPVFSLRRLGHFFDIREL